MKKLKSEIVWHDVNHELPEYQCHAGGVEFANVLVIVHEGQSIFGGLYEAPGIWKIMGTNLEVKGGVVTHWAYWPKFPIEEAK